MVKRESAEYSRRWLMTLSCVVRCSIQRYRLCAGVEYALAATAGYRMTVADALKAAGMSRRSFYEHFTGIDDVICRMQRAVSPTLSRITADRPGISEKDAYSVFTSSFPHAELLLPLMGAWRGITVTGYRCTGEAQECALRSWSDLPRPAPMRCAPVVAWARDVGGLCDERAGLSEWRAEEQIEQHS